MAKWCWGMFSGTTSGALLICYKKFAVLRFYVKLRFCGYFHSLMALLNINFLVFGADNIFNMSPSSRSWKFITKIDRCPFQVNSQKSLKFQYRKRFQTFSAIQFFHFFHNVMVCRSTVQLPHTVIYINSLNGIYNTHKKVKAQ